MLVSVNREEYWPVYEILQNKFASKEISEELYKAQKWWNSKGISIL